MDILRGIELTAQAFSYVFKAVQCGVDAEIERLEEELGRIHSADIEKRNAILLALVARLQALACSRIESTGAVVAELTAARASVIDSSRERFGPRESATSARSLLRLERGLGLAQAEHEWLKNCLSDSATLLDDQASGRRSELPSARTLKLPDDFPAAGRLLLSPVLQRAEFGYKWVGADGSPPDLDRPALVLSVDHVRRIATVSSEAASPFAYLLSDVIEPLKARVERIERDETLLLCNGLPLKLTQDTAIQATTRIGQEVPVHPHGWTLASIASAREYPLPVRLHRDIDFAATVWSPIRLVMQRDDLPVLREAYSRIVDDGAGSRPYRVSIDMDGHVIFALGRVAFVTRPDAALAAFRFLHVVHDAPRARISLQVRLKLTALLADNPDEQEVPRDRFREFVATLEADLAHESMRHNQHEGAIWLRKLSLIYQDQQRYRVERTTAGFVGATVDTKCGAIEGVVLARHSCEWLEATGLVATGSGGEWRIARFTWVNRTLRVARIEVVRPDRRVALRADSISRLQRLGEGRSEEAMSAALERTITGQFLSEAVHRHMMSIASARVVNTARGSDSVHRLLASQSPVAAIWGPPGTGKTTTLVQWLQSLFLEGAEATWPRVLITGPTHVAVDNLVGRLLDAVPQLRHEVVRYAAPGRLDDTLLAAHAHHRIVLGEQPEPGHDAATAALRKQWEKYVGTRAGAQSAARWIFQHRRLHAVTCAGLGRADFGLLKREFDLVVIDEAGKAFGAELMLPASLGRRVVLVGDHNQLPPTITAEELDESVGYRFPLDEVEQLLRRNAFEMLFEALPAESKAMLTLQYRMHEDIGYVVSQLFYDSALESRRQGGAWKATRRRLTFVDFAYDERYRHESVGRNMSLTNAAEQKFLVRLVDALAQAGHIEGQSILVICPYEAQRSRVDQLIATHGAGLNVEVTTVDAVQGGEADLVILLFTRSSGRTEFLLDRRRLNVALSRARDGVVILGSTRCLARNRAGPVQELLEVASRADSAQVVDVDTRSDYARVAARVTGSAAGRSRPTTRIRK